MDEFITVLEIIGTISFAVSGVVVGMRKNLDMFGSCMLGLITAVGGGATRDIILGLTPPSVFKDPIYAIIAVFTSVIFMISPVRRFLTKKARAYELILFYMDSLGLGVFTVVGVGLSLRTYYDYGLILHVFVGVITGVGGGVLRDVLSGNIPYIFVKHIYAIASLTGAVVCTLMWKTFSIPMIPSMLSGAAIVLAIRCLSAHYRWNLPVITEASVTKKK